jgi:hypothetical protein
VIVQLFAFGGVMGAAISPRMGLAALKILIVAYGLGLGLS